MSSMSARDRPADDPSGGLSADVGPQPWSGRLLILLGVALLGLSLRHAVTVVSPLLSTIRSDIGMGSVGSTIQGMLPTLCFGAAGFLAPALIWRVGLVRMAVAALIVGGSATAIRAFADDQTVFLVCGAVALLGMGVGNVVGPPLVKRYFPDRQGVAMSLLVITTQAGATIPAMLAIPLADQGDWRLSVGVWAVLMILAALPWIAVIVADRKAVGERSSGSETSAASAPASYGLKVLLSSPISVGAAIFYGMAALNIYAMLAWMPTIFISFGHTQAQAAGMYSIYTFVTLPMALITPAITTRLKNPLPFGLALSVVSAIGYVGIAFAPFDSAAFWAFVAGLGGGAFPFAMTMFNLRARSAAGSAAVTGFALGCGYALGTLGPLIGGLLSNLTGGWTLPLMVFASTALPMMLGAVLLTRDVKMEDAAAQA